MSARPPPPQAASPTPRLRRARALPLGWVGDANARASARCVSDFERETTARVPGTTMAPGTSIIDHWASVKWGGPADAGSPVAHIPIAAHAEPPAQQPTGGQRSDGLGSLSERKWRLGDASRFTIDGGLHSQYPVNAPLNRPQPSRAPAEAWVAPEPEQGSETGGAAMRSPRMEPSSPRQRGARAADLIFPDRSAAERLAGESAGPSSPAASAGPARGDGACSPPLNRPSHTPALRGTKHAPSGREQRADLGVSSGLGRFWSGVLGS